MTNMTDREALDELAQWLGNTESWNGGDVCEALADYIAKTGRPHPGDADDYPHQWRAYLADRLNSAESDTHLPELLAFAKDMRHAYTQDLADNVAERLADAVATYHDETVKAVEAAIRLVSPDHITPVAKRQILAALHANTDQDSLT